MFKSLTQLGNSLLSQSPLARDWRFSLTIGLAIGFALPTARGVANALEPSLGHWVAFAASLVAAAAVGGLVSLTVSWVIKPGGRGRA